MIKMISFGNFESFDKIAPLVTEADAEKTADEFSAFFNLYSQPGTPAQETIEISKDSIETSSEKDLDVVEHEAQKSNGSIIEKPFDFQRSANAAVDEVSEIDAVLTKGNDLPLENAEAGGTSREVSSLFHGGFDPPIQLEPRGQQPLGARKFKQEVGVEPPPIISITPEPRPVAGRPFPNLSLTQIEPEVRPPAGRFFQTPPPTVPVEDAGLAPRVQTLILPDSQVRELTETMAPDPIQTGENSHLQDVPSADPQQNPEIAREILPTKERFSEDSLESYDAAVRSVAESELLLEIPRFDAAEQNLELEPAQSKKVIGNEVSGDSVEILEVNFAVKDPQITVSPKTNLTAFDPAKAPVEPDGIQQQIPLQLRDVAREISEVFQTEKFNAVTVKKILADEREIYAAREQVQNVRSGLIPTLNASPNNPETTFNDPESIEPVIADDFTILELPPFESSSVKQTLFREPDAAQDIDLTVKIPADLTHEAVQKPQFPSEIIIDPTRTTGIIEVSSEESAPNTPTDSFFQKTFEPVRDPREIVNSQSLIDTPEPGGESLPSGKTAAVEEKTPIADSRTSFFNGIPETVMETVRRISPDPPRLMNFEKPLSPVKQPEITVNNAIEDNAPVGGRTLIEDSQPQGKSTSVESIVPDPSDSKPVRNVIRTESLSDMSSAHPHFERTSAFEDRVEATAGTLVAASAKDEVDPGHPTEIRSVENSLKPVEVSDQPIPKPELPAAYSNEFAGLNFGRLVKRQNAVVIPAEPVRDIIRSVPPVAEQLTSGVVKSAEFAVAAGDAQLLKMRLKPAELGEVDVRIERDSNGKISAHFHASGEASHKVIAENLNQLRESMQNAGLQVENLEVSSSPYSSNGEERREDRAREQNYAGNGRSSSEDETPADQQLTRDLPAERLVSLQA